VLVRERRTSDEPQLLEIARLVHEQDGYPLYLPDSDYRTFLLGHESLGAWVAEDDACVVGQVALHPHSSSAVMAFATSAFDQPVERLCVVARLLVHPNRRRLGAGAQLLDRAAREAVALGLCPILDVVTDLAAAILLYERQRWIRLGEVTVTFRGGVTIQEYVYVAPLDIRPEFERRVLAAGAHPPMASRRIARFTTEMLEPTSCTGVQDHERHDDDEDRAQQDPHMSDGSRRRH